MSQHPKNRTRIIALLAAAAAVPTALFGFSVAQADTATQATVCTGPVPNGSVYWASMNNGIVSYSKLAPDTRAAIALGTVQANTTSHPVPVKNVGGSVYTAGAVTEIPMDLALQPGRTYLLTYSAQVQASVAAAAGDPEVRPQIMPWLMKGDDSTFSADEAVPGAVSANAVLPRVLGRHATMSGSVVYTAPVGGGVPVALQLAAHSYADDGSDAREGDFAITTATLAATLIG